MVATDLPAAALDVLDELRGRDAVARLYSRDTSLWGDAEEVRAVAATRLGWLDTAAPPVRWVDDLERFADASSRAGLERAVLCGMGGSGLGAHVLASVAGAGGDADRLVLLDSTHPDAVRTALGGGLERALVLVSSKSGTTVETRAMGDYAAARVPGPAHLVAVTDAGSPLDEAASGAGWREVFRNPADIGGRFSALSLYGMVPAAAAGLPVAELWSRAGAAARRCGPGTRLEDNPGAVVAAFAVAAARAGRDKLTLLCAEELEPFGLWVEQLLAESTGKDGTGIVPVVGEPPGTPADYGDDRAFVELRWRSRPVPGAAALADAGRPLLTLDVAEPLEIAGVMLEWMVATALAGALLGVDPFDQPDVASAKRATADVLRDVTGGATIEPAADAIAAAVATARAGDYVAVEAFLPSEPGVWRALRALQEAVRAATGCAATANLGPRYLHSTGQLHKGGPDTVVVVQLLDGATGEPVPGRDYDFGTLIAAQAAGDARALRARGRRVARVPVDRARLTALAAALNAAR